MTATTSPATPLPSRPDVEGRPSPSGSPDRPGAGGVDVRALLATARPRQWLKNGLLLAAPVAGGAVLAPTVALEALWAVLVFTLAAASTYFVNDVRDVAADRRHPTKRYRPVAAGLVSIRTAQRTAVALGLLAVAAAVPLGPALTAVVVTYLAMTLCYSAWWKHLPVVDVMVVAGGFVLRAAGGAAATGVAMSSWFLLVVLFGSLYVVAAKRYAEQVRTAGDGSARTTVEQYPAAWLQQLLTLSLTGTVLTYATWALQYVGTDVAHPLLAATVVPFLAVMLRYSLLVSHGQGEAPESVLVSDRFLLLAGAAWGAAVLGALYAA